LYNIKQHGSQHCHLGFSLTVVINKPLELRRWHWVWR